MKRKKRVKHNPVCGTLTIGPELKHYGREGMRWGQHIFGDNPERFGSRGGGFEGTAGTDYKELAEARAGIAALERDVAKRISARQKREREERKKAPKNYYQERMPEPDEDLPDSYYNSHEFTYKENSSTTSLLARNRLMKEVSKLSYATPGDPSSGYFFASTMDQLFDELEF